MEHYNRCMRRIRLLGQLCILLALPTFLQNNALACLALSGSGLIGVNHETAIIIWDRANQTEHFIRAVTLNSTAEKAGFLVPTPTTPELALADSRILDLPEAYLPIPRTLSLFSRIGAAADTAGIAPRVVAEQDIGDYHAVVLDASDAQGLGDWLKANGYPWTESSRKWLAPYLAAKWKITAFKLRRSESGNIGTQAIRMSFKTDRPFFPYREPAAASKLSGSQRVLQIAFLGDKRVIGKLEDGSSWPAHLDFAGSTTPPSYAHIDKNDWLKYAKLSGIKLPPRLTYFSDNSNPRPGSSDLYFSTSPDQSNAP
jgi:hypothetical protein